MSNIQLPNDPAAALREVARMIDGPISGMHYAHYDNRLLASECRRVADEADSAAKLRSFFHGLANVSAHVIQATPDEADRLHRTADRCADECEECGHRLMFGGEPCCELCDQPRTTEAERSTYGECGPEGRNFSPRNDAQKG